MFIYNGRLYGIRVHKKCARCHLFRDFNGNIKEACAYCDENIVRPYELFISRLFHAILEVFYDREIREAGK